MSAGGTVNYTDGYGRAEGPNPAILKDHAFLQTKSFVTAGLGTSATILTDASGVTGVEGSFYSIWFISAACDDTSPWLALLWETNGQHTAGAGSDRVVTNLAVTSYGTHVWSSASPIKLEANNGLQLDNVNVPGSSEQMLTIGYTLTTPTS